MRNLRIIFDRKNSVKSVGISARNTLRLVRLPTGHENEDQTYVGTQFHVFSRNDAIVTTSHVERSNEGLRTDICLQKTDICLLQVFAVGPHVSALPAGPAHSSNLHAFDTVQKTTVFIDTQYRLIESVAMTNQSSYLPRGKPIFTVHL